MMFGFLGLSAPAWSTRAPSARSVGSPTNGALLGGVPLRERAEIRLRWPDGPRWALPQLVSMLERAAQRVEHRFPGSILLVGDLSREQGGAISGHASHESGRDADVGFYYADPQGKSVVPPRLLPVAPSGKAASTTPLRFDEARNWALVESFLTDPSATIQSIFISAPLKRRLIDFARQNASNPVLVARAEELLHQPMRGHPHDNHFHVRIACPDSQGDVCVPNPTAASRMRTASLEPARTGGSRTR